ncbi:MAG: hypothetical protein EBQ95_03975 [Gammaproteobacteria bacterium]|nr:hypothetical protein [Gammaproteobacteria bacterium]
MKSKPYISSQDFFFSTLKEDLNPNFTPLEWACFLGNLENVKNILHSNNPIQDNPCFLNAILLSIQQNHENIFNYFLERHDFHPIFENHLQSIQNHIEEYGHLRYHQKINTIIQNEQIFETNEIIKRLASYYHTQLGSAALEQHLQNLRNYISKIYHQSKAIYITPDQVCVHLPLNWESFQLMASDYDISSQKGMLNAYCKHPIHTAWRYLHPSHAWFANANLPEFTYEELIWKSLTQKKWIIILMWLAVSDLQQPPPKNHPFIKTVEDRIHLFLQHFSEIHNHIQEPGMHMLHAIIGHPMVKIVSAQSLIQEQKNFVLNILFKRYSKTPTNVLISSTSQEFVLSEEEQTEFSMLMQRKLGNHWSLNPELMNESKTHLQTIHQKFPELIEQVLELHAHTRQISLQHHFFQSEELHKSHDSIGLTL